MELPSSFSVVKRISRFSSKSETASVESVAKIRSSGGIGEGNKDRLHYRGDSLSDPVRGEVASTFDGEPSSFIGELVSKVDGSLVSLISLNCSILKEGNF